MKLKRSCGKPKDVVGCKDRKQPATPSSRNLPDIQGMADDAKEKAEEIANQLPSNPAANFGKVCYCEGDLCNDKDHNPGGAAGSAAARNSVSLGFTVTAMAAAQMIYISTLKHLITL